MPIYEYQCEKCQHEFEREQRITADPIKTCPMCKARRIKKLISQTSFVLKGGGWYNDLYSSSKKDDQASSTDAKSEAKSDSKKSDGDSKSDKSKKSAEKGTKASDKSSKGKSSKSAA